MPKKYTFFNIPKKYSMQDCKDAIDGIIKKYSKNNELISIYDWGKPSIAGISDMDILLVFGDNSRSPLPFRMRSFNFLNSRARYLARHPFMFIDESGFKNIRCIYPDGNFELLHGKNIKINKLSPEERHYSRIALLNDIIIRHYPRDFIAQLVSRRINARDTLLRLNSLKYSISILEKITKEKNSEWNEKLMAIHELRKNWFSNPNFELLISLNSCAVNIAMEIIEKFKTFILKNNLAEIGDGNIKNVKYNGIKNKSIFIRDWNREDALEEMLNIANNKKKYRSIFPIELSAQLIEYSKYDGRISSCIKGNISSRINYKLKYKKYKTAVKNRIAVLNSQAELAFKLRHSDFPAFFDFGCRNKSGINNWVLNALDKARF